MTVAYNTRQTRKQEAMPRRTQSGEETKDSQEIPMESRDLPKAKSRNGD
jgi:hypothetical protein